MSAGARRWLVTGLALGLGVAGLANPASLPGGPIAALAASAVPTPVLGQSETLTLVSGTVTVRVRGSSGFVSLSGMLSVPDQTEVDATHGRVSIEVATPTPAQTATALAYSGRFLLHQDAAAPAETHLTLSQPLACKAPRHVHSAAAASSKSQHASKSRKLWVSDKGGSWGAEGRYVSTTVEGTRWLIADACQRSRVKVAAGIVAVHDLVSKQTVSVSAGHEYVAVEEGGAFLPPPGEVFTGVTGGSASAFGRQTGKHPAIFGYFATWNRSIGAPIAYARGSGGRLLLHISTDVGYGSGASEGISPGAIAAGSSDGYLMQLGQELAASGRPAYIALLPEMNQTNNAYCAFNANGSSRGASNSTSAYRQAWRRAVLIIRGGSVAAINHRLRALRLPAVQSAQSVLPTPRVAFLWAPQTAGSPDTPGNAPAAYYPGSAYVDIVGTDFYSAFPNFSGLAHLYAQYSNKRFAFNEWAMWQSGDPGFVDQFFNFVRSHRRIGLLVYNQGLTVNGPFRLSKFPAATGEIRRRLASPSYLAFAPEEVNLESEEGSTEAEEAEAPPEEPAPAPGRRH
jgi:hypothetical protein